MKRMLVYTLCALSIFSLLSGCSGEDKSAQSSVSSGIVDEEYIGNPNPVIKENYKQTPEEAQAQADILKAIEAEGSAFEGGGLSGH